MFSCSAVQLAVQRLYYAYQVLLLSHVDSACREVRSQLLQHSCSRVQHSTAQHSSNTGMSYCCNRRAPAGSGEERWPHIPSRLYLGRNRVTFQNQYLVPTWYVLRPFRLLYAYSSREKHRAAYTRSTGHSTSRTS